jgi:maltooligosyltrehalose trehalohydrolase
VELEIGNERHPMQQGKDGWWVLPVSLSAELCDYGFYVDGRGPFPDPRARWQPNGVHALSRLWDHSSFQWKDGEWVAPPLETAVLYELHVGTFSPGGTFVGAIEKLDYLVELGVTHVELMPVHEFAGERGWGYDSVGLFAPHHAYGDPDDLKRLVDACHGAGLAVLLDVVFNHLGPSGNYLRQFGPYFTQAHANPWGEAINFDQRGSDEVRRFFCDCALMWARDYHVDGFRLDAVHGMFDISARHFLEQLADEIAAYAKASGRRIVLIAESDLNDPRLVVSPERGGLGLDAAWNDDFHHALHCVLTGEKDGYYSDFGTLGALAKSLRDIYVYDGGFSRYRGRCHGRAAKGVSANRFQGYIQNHDQVGNRAQGERLSQMLTLGHLQIASAVVMMSPFLPLLFQGEEWGAMTPFYYFTDYPEKDLADAVKGRRAEEFSAFGWRAEELADPQAIKTFEDCRLRWDELDHPTKYTLLAWYKKLIRLRRSEPLLAGEVPAEAVPAFDEAMKWFLFTRGPFLIICNLAAGFQQVRLPSPHYQMLLASDDSLKVEDGTMGLPGLSVAILKEERPCL